MKYMIETDGLCKQYKRQYSVKNVSLKVRPGCVYGFLGPNGAGKSTTMKMLLGLVKPTQGSIRIFGKEILEKNRIEILKNTGSLIEAPSYYGHLNGRENLKIVQTLKGVPEKEIDEVLDIVRLEGQQNKILREVLAYPERRRQVEEEIDRIRDVRGIMKEKVVQENGGYV